MPTDEKSRLATEMAFYAEHKAEWLESHSGQKVTAQIRIGITIYLYL